MKKDLEGTVFGDLFESDLLRKARTAQTQSCSSRVPAEGVISPPRPGADREI